MVFRITFWVLTAIGTLWIVAVGALLYSMNALSMGSEETQTIANGSIYMAVLAFALVINVAIIAPALLMLQPFRLWHVVRAEKQAITPRQRFRGATTSSASYFEIDIECLPQQHTRGRTIHRTQWALVFSQSSSPRLSP